MVNRSRRRSMWAKTTALALVLTLGACGSSTRAVAPRVASTQSTSSAVPSATTTMICAPEAEREIAAAVGLSTIRPVVGTWKAPRYSCEYVYRQGSFTLAVQQLPDPMSTARAFTALAASLGRGMTLTGLGQDATTTARGAVIVRKDNKVLTVDPRGLPARFGNPADTRANVAITLAATIMGCWTE